MSSTGISTSIACSLAIACALTVPTSTLLALKRKRRDFCNMDISHKMPLALSNTELSQPILFTNTEVIVVIGFPKCCAFHTFYPLFNLILNYKYRFCSASIVVAYGFNVYDRKVAKQREITSYEILQNTLCKGWDLKINKHAYNLPQFLKEL